MDSISTIVSSGSLLIALPIAFAAGLLAFLSPCVLPLAPGYISYITGLTGAEISEGRKGRVLLGYPAQRMDRSIAAYKTLRRMTNAAAAPEKGSKSASE